LKNENSYSGSGKHFDPELVKIFLLCEKEFVKVVIE